MKALLVAFLLPLSALGMDNLPAWRMSGDAACYDLDGAKQLVEADIAFSKCKLATLPLDLVKEQVVLLEERVRVLQEVEAVLKKRNQELESSQVKAGPSIAWYVAGGLALVLVGVTIEIILR